MHSTSCASERNLSVFGRLYDRLRGILHHIRAEKMVYLAFNRRIQRGKQTTIFKDLPFNDRDIEEDNEMGAVTDEPGTSGMPACERRILLTSGVAHATADVQKVEKIPQAGALLN
jgi:hypothetical protein